MRYSVNMIIDFEQRLHAYGELAVRVGLNLQPGQRLLVIGPLASGGVSLEAAPLVREIVTSAYKAGAPLVEVLWGDDALQVARFTHAGPESFSEVSHWVSDALVKHVDGGHAVLSVYANDPDLLKQAPPENVGVVQQAISRSVTPFRDRISRNQTNWAVIAAAGAGWAAKVFPDLAPKQRIERLWELIIELCRLDREDPVAAWQAHIAALAARSDHLNCKRYVALWYRGPGTDLRIGLAEGHVWVSGKSVTQTGIPFTANLPTEEVFTMPHKDRVDGTLRSTKPLSYGGTLIEDFSLEFKEGRVVRVEAAQGETVLRQLVATDEGAARLGEIALVPHGSPISRSGLLFYNTLFDENAASHVALGSAYKFTVKGGETMTEDAFQRVGGNRSIVHVDFMIGSGTLDVDGVTADGITEPLMRAGEWAD